MLTSTRLRPVWGFAELGRLHSGQRPPSSSYQLVNSADGLSHGIEVGSWELISEARNPREQGRDSSNTVLKLLAASARADLVLG
jgi:hypothetical protein